MLVREVNRNERKAFNEIVRHPLQSWEWGEFREKTGVKVVRLGGFEAKKLVRGYQITIHHVPYTSMNVAYFPKGDVPDEVQVETLKKIGRDNNCVFVKLEPNVGVPVGAESVEVSAHQSIRDFLLTRGCQQGRPLFTQYTFQVDLSKSEEELLASMKQKTRYNIGVARRYGLEVQE
ncbi:MAG: peptidoglycan bridge formation glycyltransferase FemA/FemB family protein [Candidatus Chisholmbacteria bacterium]|nr:peptidoglycan bridge formation glycyltransferase FemA/FemB family protein [Candidatus Chisholmbacteria bacterium]